MFVSRPNFNSIKCSIPMPRINKSSIIQFCPFSHWNNVRIWPIFALDRPALVSQKCLLVADAGWVFFFQGKVILSSVVRPTMVFSFIVLNSSCTRWTLKAIWSVHSTRSTTIRSMTWIIQGKGSSSDKVCVQKKDFVLADCSSVKMAIVMSMLLAWLNWLCTMWIVYGRWLTMV